VKQGDQDRSDLCVAAVRRFDGLKAANWSFNDDRAQQLTVVCNREIARIMVLDDDSAAAELLAARNEASATAQDVSGLAAQLADESGRLTAALADLKTTEDLLTETRAQAVAAEQLNVKLEAELAAAQSDLSATLTAFNDYKSANPPKTP